MNSEPLELLAVGEFVSVSVGFVWAPYSEALRDARTASLVDEIRAKVEGAEILDAGTSRVRLAWTVADVRALRVGHAGHDLDVRVVFAPACQGKMTLILLSASNPGTSAARRPTRGFRASTSASRPPRAKR